MPTDFNDLAYFGITNVQMNGKCWNQGVTFSSRTIFHFEQCVYLCKKCIEFWSHIMKLTNENRVHYAKREPSVYMGARMYLKIMRTSQFCRKLSKDNIKKKDVFRALH